MSSQAGASGQRRPEDHGNARPVREFRMGRADRVGNAIFSMIARVGIGPADLLTTRGRKTGQARTTPVILVKRGEQRWLVAPYGAVSWVLNARAAGQVTLRRGRDRRVYAVRELPPEQAGPILRHYIRIASATRPYFQAKKDAPVAEFTAEAHRHPVFELTQIGAVTTMRAMVQHRYGPPDVLVAEEIARPAVGDEDVLIRVHAVGLNVADDIIMRGVPYFLRLLAGLRRPAHGVRGVDVAGTVTETGAKITDLRPGAEVFGGTAGALAGGALAEYALIPRDKVARKPAGLTFEQAASVPVAAITALKALRDAAGVQPGQKVLINGASGGVGTFAVQMAKAMGAQVTAVCSTRNTGLVRSLGADTVIDYTRDDFTQADERYDVILDNVANHRLRHCLRALARTGILVPNANTSGRWLGGMGRMIRARMLAPLVPQAIRTCHGAVNQPDLVTLTELIESGQVAPVIDRTFTLAESPEAIRYLERGHARGKIVIAMSGATRAPCLGP